MIERAHAPLCRHSGAWSMRSMQTASRFNALRHCVENGDATPSLKIA
jgi:hypothetical protein